MPDCTLDNEAFLRPDHGKEGSRQRKGRRAGTERRPWSGGKEAARGRVEEMEGKQRPFAVNVLLLHESVVSSQVLEMRIGAQDAG